MEETGDFIHYIDPFLLILVILLLVAYDCGPETRQLFSQKASHPHSNFSCLAIQKKKKGYHVNKHRKGKKNQ